MATTPPASTTPPAAPAAQKPSKTAFLSRIRIFGSGISLSQKIFFVQQLGIMVRTGISLSVALKTLTDQTQSKFFKGVLLDIEQHVEKGQLLSAGLRKHKKIFGELFISMIEAGETSGKLEDVLEQLFTQMKKDHAIVAKVRGAMIYPVIVITMMVVIGIMMMIYVIPSITTVFKELNTPLPLPTRMLIVISDFIVSNGILVSLTVIIVLGGFIAFIRNKKGRLLWHRFILHLPVAGTIIKKINIARFSRTISSLMKTDIPIVQSFQITANILGNLPYRMALTEAQEKIKKGIKIEESLRQYPKLFPPVVLQMILVGEETGALDDILAEAAVFYEEEVDQTMNNLPTILEPLLITVLGVGVGAMAVAVIMPLYSLSEAI